MSESQSPKAPPPASPQTFFVLLSAGDKIECHHAPDAFIQRAAWGVVLADGIRHIARARAECFGEDEEETRKHIVEVLVKEMEWAEEDPNRGNLSGELVQ